MLYSTNGQMQVALILFLVSSILCVIAFLINFLINKIKFKKFKFSINFIFDLLFILIFTLAFIFICSMYNYGVIRLFCIVFYVLPAIILLSIYKHIKISRNFALNNYSNKAKQSNKENDDKNG